MAKPIEHTISANKKQIMDILPDAANKLKMDVLGCNQKLGLASLRRPNRHLLYAHFVEVEDGKTRLTIAPGLPHLGD